MARAKRWTIPFKSLNGTDCRIDIYDEDWSGSVTEISTANVSSPGYPAADPFYYEEEADENLLTVVRYKTGYINLVETSYNALIDLYPETNTEHYVEFYYGSRLDFTGYIQSQSFENQWTAPPRSISLPVVSPLGLLDGFYFNYPNPSALYVDDIISTVMTNLNAAYTKVIKPSTVNNFRLRSTLLCPMNDNPTKADGSDCFKPRTYMDFIEAYCHVHGLMVHDTPDAIVFSRFDYDGEYTQSAGDGDDEYDLEDYTSIADDNHNESLVRPLRNLTLNYEGELLPTESLNMKASSVYVSSDDEGWAGDIHIVASWLKLVGPMITSRFLLNTQSIDSSFKPTQTGVIGGSFGTGDDAFIVVTRGAYMGVNDEVVVVHFFDYPTLDDDETMIVNITQDVRENIITIPDEDITGMKYAFEVDGEYYNPQTYQWDSAVTYMQYLSGVDIYVRNVPRGGSFNVHFYMQPESVVANGNMAIIKSITLKPQGYNKWTYKEYDDREKILEGHNKSIEDGNIGLLFNRDHPNSNSVVDIMDSIQSFVAPEYPYIFVAQNRLNIDVKLSSALPSIPYLPKWEYWVSGWKWRIIAQSFNPWDDTYKLTLHRSSTIET